VPDATTDDPAFMFAREFSPIGRWGNMGRTIGIPVEGSGRHSDDRSSGKPLLEIIVLRLAFRQTDPPAIVPLLGNLP
jgi:hypothetical protein